MMAQRRSATQAANFLGRAEKLGNEIVDKHHACARARNSLMATEEVPPPTPIAMLVHADFMILSGA